MNINHIFFDLDRTLWDFDKNSQDTLTQLVKRFYLQSRGIDSTENFINIYQSNNYYTNWLKNNYDINILSDSDFGDLNYNGILNITDIIILGVITSSSIK